MRRLRPKLPKFQFIFVSGAIKDQEEFTLWKLEVQLKWRHLKLMHNLGTEQKVFRRELKNERC